MRYLIYCVAVLVFCFSLSLAEAQNKVVVVPLGGAVGDAVPSDVVKGKTFSSKTGKGVIGTLELKVGKIFTNSIGIQFRLIPAGSFVMGSPAGTGDVTHRPIWPAELGRINNELQHIVILTKPFYMQTTEVTQGQWQQVMGSNPSYFAGCGLDCPVEMVSWYDAQNFIDALNASEGRTNCNNTPNTCYSLPTEAQWEYAARAGTVTALYNGDITSTVCTVDPKLDAIGWYCGNSGGTTHPVAQKEPNNWGLYDMSGNVFEMCKDRYDPYPNGPIQDPLGTIAYERVERGGSWDSHAYAARSAYRGVNDLPGDPYYFQGFRLVLPPGQ